MASKVLRFIKTCKVLRDEYPYQTLYALGGIPGPSKWSIIKRKRYHNQKMAAAYSALHAFGRKHPDSKRQRITKRRDLTIAAQRSAKYSLVGR
jgi:hypothetical protein